MKCGWGLAGGCAGFPAQGGFETRHYDYDKGEVGLWFVDPRYPPPRFRPRYRGVAHALAGITDGIVEVREEYGTAPGNAKRANQRLVQGGGQAALHFFLRPRDAN